MHKISSSVIVTPTRNSSAYGVPPYRTSGARRTRRTAQDGRAAGDDSRTGAACNAGGTGDHLRTARDCRLAVPHGTPAAAAGRTGARARAAAGTGIDRARTCLDRRKGTQPRPAAPGHRGPGEPTYPPHQPEPLLRARSEPSASDPRRTPAQPHGPPPLPNDGAQPRGRRRRAKKKGGRVSRDTSPMATLSGPRSD